MKSLSFALSLGLAALSGCGPKSAPHDLDKVMAGVRTGMTELDLTSQVGVPTKIEVKGDMRDLRYEGKDGKYVLVRVKGNVVFDVMRF